MTTTAGERSYEGHVRFAAGEVISVQCFEGRHGECPQVDVPEGTETDRNGPLEGYHCECSGCPAH